MWTYHSLVITHYIVRRVHATSESEGSFRCRRALPVPWRGLRDAALQAASAVPTATFVRIHSLLLPSCCCHIFTRIPHKRICRLYAFSFSLSKQDATGFIGGCSTYEGAIDMA